MRPAHFDDPALLADIRAGMLEAGFTPDGVLGLLGPHAYSALASGVTYPARRRLQAAAAARGSEPPSAESPETTLLGLLIQTFLVGEQTNAGDWGSAGGARLLRALSQAGLVGVRELAVAARLAVHPHPAADSDAADAGDSPQDSSSTAGDSGDTWYVVCDLGAPSDPEHVLGPAGAALTLAGITPRARVASALDLGCGSGIQALHAANHCARVVATDTNVRALWLTELSAALSGIPADRIAVRQGSLYDPVAADAFDLIVANPPFVISPGRRFTYRDGGLPGDELSRQVVRGACTHLSPGGVAVMLVNWLISPGEDWRDRVAGWVDSPDISAWIVVRDVSSVLDYSLLWLRDAGLRPPAGGGPDAQFDAALGQWLDSFTGVDAVAFGWVVLQRTTGTPWSLVSDLSQAPRLPVGHEVAALLEGWSRVSDLHVVDLLAAPLSLAPGAVVTAERAFLGEGWLPGPTTVGVPGLFGEGGWREAVAIAEPVLDALTGDPGRSIGERLDEVAVRRGLDETELLAAALPEIRELAALGLVTGLPAGPIPAR